MISSLGILDSGDLRPDVQVLLTRRALEKKRKGEERNGSKTKFLSFQRWCQIYIGSIYILTSPFNLGKMKDFVSCFSDGLETN